MSKMSDYLVNQIGTSADYRARLDQNIPEPDNSGDSAPGFLARSFAMLLVALKEVLAAALTILARSQNHRAESTPTRGGIALATGSSTTANI